MCGQDLHTYSSGGGAHCLPLTFSSARWKSNWKERSLKWIHLKWESNSNDVNGGAEDFENISWERKKGDILNLSCIQGNLGSECNYKLICRTNKELIKGWFGRLIIFPTNCVIGLHVLLHIMCDFLSSVTKRVSCANVYKGTLHFPKSLSFTFESLLVGAPACHYLVRFMVLSCTARPSHSGQLLWARSEHPSVLLHLWAFWNLASFIRFTIWLDLHCTSTASQHDSQAFQCWVRVCVCVCMREKEILELCREECLSGAQLCKWSIHSWNSLCYENIYFPLQPPDRRYPGSQNLDQKDLLGITVLEWVRLCQGLPESRTGNVPLKFLWDMVIGGTTLFFKFKISF